MSAAVAPTTIRTVLGTWTASPTRPAHETIDLEAQVVTGTYEPGPSTIPAPPPARALTPRTQSAGTDPIDDFFGVSRVSHGTFDSRHDDRHPVIWQDDVPPPPYAEAGDLPAYAAVAEPPTLAMYLFKFGFLFPLFWLAGIFVLLCPLTPPENWEPTKTEAERAELLGLMRRTEVKWAKRCLIAFAVLALAVIAIALIAVFAVRS